MLRLEPRVATRRRAEAFGWHAIEVDGHDLAAIDAAYAEALERRGTPDRDRRADAEGQGRVRSSRTRTAGTASRLGGSPRRAVAELGGERHLTGRRARSRARRAARCSRPRTLELARYEPGSEVATRKAYGDALVAVGAPTADVVALDGEVSNSTYAGDLPDGLSGALLRDVHRRAADGRRGGRRAGARARSRSPRPSPRSSPAPTTSSAWRRSRRATIALCGSHAGVSIGEDGPSQMALEDLAMMRAVCGSTVLYPCDANQTAKLVAAMADLRGHLLPAHHPRRRRR